MLSRIARRVILWQAGVGVVGAVVWLVVGGPRHALAAFAGGGIAAVLSLYVALKMLASAGADPATMVQAFFRAQTLKLVLACVLFAFAALLFGDVYLPLVSTFAGSLLVFWCALRWAD